MHVTRIEDITPDMRELVGGKAVGLGRLIDADERVPPGFCLTTTAYHEQRIPVPELHAAYRALGGGPVAVRSSATAEDLPDASFAGQQDTVLDVVGTAALEAAIRRCWDSLNSTRAVAYRESNGIPHSSAHMAVIVQRMVSPRAAGVLFTADPVTGRRDRMTVDAAPGLGTTVVDGTVVPDHYVLDDTPSPESGCLSRDDLVELRALGDRLQNRFNAPQDIEWAFDPDGTLWVLQSRPITTLFPLPPDTGLPGPRVYFNIGPFQGLHGPITPMGVSVLRIAAAETLNAFGGDAGAEDGPRGFVPVAGRVFADITTMVRDKRMRRRLPAQLRLSQGPRVADAIVHVMEDPRFTPRRRGAPVRIGMIVKALSRHAFPAVGGIAGALLRPAAARERAWAASESLMSGLGARRSATTGVPRLDEADVRLLTGRPVMRLTYPLIAGMIATRAAGRLLSGIATEAEIDTVMRGMPHNVTTEMDLALWRMARRAADHRELLLDTSPSVLADGFRAGTLPDIGLTGFLQRYGHRTAAEIDVGIPRWAEDPTPVFTAIANYLRIEDPEQFPDRRFARAVAEAEAMLDELDRRGRRRRPIRGRLAVALLRRARAVGGLRELLKFSWIPVLARLRLELSGVGKRLVERGLLDHPDDVMFLDHREVEVALAGGDQRGLVRVRRLEYAREKRRRIVPDVLLSDGTDAESLLPSMPPEDGALTGMAGSPGIVTGPARIVTDPNTARLEPGEILVAPSTDPGWTPLFMTAGGLVTETGGPNAHGPTVAREYGIPAVIGVRAATRLIRTGDVITVDGFAGAVRPRRDPDHGEEGVPAV